MTAVLAFKFRCSLRWIGGPLTLLAWLRRLGEYKRTAAGGVPPHHTVLLSATQTRGRQPFQSFLRHLAITLVSEPLRRFFQRDPQSLCDLMPRFRRQIAEPSRAIT